MSKTINTTNEVSEKVITKSELIEKVANESGHTIEEVETVLNAMGDSIFDTIKKADEETNVKIKLFDGFSITSHFQAEKEKHDNARNKDITVPSRIKTKGIFSRTYLEKLTFRDK